jgi:hypothetical protein
LKFFGKFLGNFWHDLEGVGSDTNVVVTDCAVIEVFSDADVSEGVAVADVVESDVDDDRSSEATAVAVVAVDDKSSPNEVDHGFGCVRPEYDDDSAEMEAAIALLDASQAFCEVEANHTSLGCGPQ